MSISDSFSPFTMDYSIDPLAFEPKEEIVRRTLSSMKDAYMDREAVAKTISEKDPLIVQVFMAPVPAEKGFLMVNINAVYAGKVGNEYFMTMGHIHDDPVGAPEVYITMKGQGKLVLQTKDGRTHVADMLPGKINYIPATFAHRCVNTGNSEPLVYIGVFPSATKRDYSFTPADFKELVVEENGQPKLINNPRYRHEQ